MKTFEDLKRLREQLKVNNSLRHDGGTQIIVAMGTCGIAAGARQVMTAILDEVAKRQLQEVKIRQTGCIGMCDKEVLVDVVRPGQPRITYGKVTPAHVSKIISDHVMNGQVVEELVVGKVTE